MNIQIKNEVKLKEVLNVFSWLDKQRWKIHESPIKYKYPDMTNANIIFAHWITYIFNIRTKIERIWGIGVWICSDIVQAYRKSEENIHDRLKEGEKNGRPTYKLVSLIPSPNGKTSFSVERLDLWADYMFRTFEILDNPLYQRDLISYIVHFLKKYQARKPEDLLLRIAGALQILTYDQKSISSLENDLKFEKYLKKFENQPFHRVKRTWCCLRDYRVGVFHDVFCDAIRERVGGSDAEELITLWDKLPPDLLELPGDTHTTNVVFKNNLLSKLIKIPPEDANKTTPQIVRALYKQMKARLPDFYPAQMDVLFDFVPRMCKIRGCNLCPFGESGAALLCNPSDGKNLCPLLIHCCGYRIICQEQTCPIIKFQGRGACQMLKEDERQKIWDKQERITPNRGE